MVQPIEAGLSHFHSNMRDLEGYPILGFVPSIIRSVVSTTEVIYGVAATILCSPCYCCASQPTASTTIYIYDGLHHLSESLMNIFSCTLYQTCQQNHCCNPSNSNYENLERS